jgi:hypothetical protein
MSTTTDTNNPRVVTQKLSDADGKLDLGIDIGGSNKPIVADHMVIDNHKGVEDNFVIFEHDGKRQLAQNYTANGFWLIRAAVDRV